MNWAWVIVIVLAVVIVFLLVTNSSLAGLIKVASPTFNSVSATHTPKSVPTTSIGPSYGVVSIPDLTANPQNYFNSTISVRGKLESSADAELGTGAAGPLIMLPDNINYGI